MILLLTLNHQESRTLSRATQYPHRMTALTLITWNLLPLECLAFVRGMSGTISYRHALVLNAPSTVDLPNMKDPQTRTCHSSFPAATNATIDFSTICLNAMSVTAQHMTCLGNVDSVEAMQSVNAGVVVLLPLFIRNGQPWRGVLPLDLSSKVVVGSGNTMKSTTSSSRSQFGLIF